MNESSKGYVQFQKSRNRIRIAIEYHIYPCNTAPAKFLRTHTRINIIPKLLHYRVDTYHAISKAPDSHQPETRRMPSLFKHSSFDRNWMISVIITGGIPWSFGSWVKATPKTLFRALYLRWNNILNTSINRLVDEKQIVGPYMVIQNAQPFSDITGISITFCGIRRKNERQLEL